MELRPSPRARAAQWLLLLAVVMVLGLLAWQAGANLDRRHLGFGFGFLSDGANFDIPFRMVPWKVGDTYTWALVVCVLNTLLVSVMSIVAATLFGLLVGVMRLSANWLVRNIALVFIELVRNTPQLVQIVFWYVAILQSLPPPRQSMVVGGVLLNIRGLYLPSPVSGPAMTWLAPPVIALLLATPFAWRRFGPRALLLPAVALAAYAFGIQRIDWPVLRGFNIAGGTQIPPELAALWLGLSIYGAAFIAEIIRAAILSVSRGQKEAALSLGLRPGQVLAKIVLPQALRVMIPPLTSQYLNLIKSSSLGAAVAYPELFQIFAGTVLNQTGKELETFLILMAIFLSISLLTSLLMNWYNRRVALVER